MKNFFVTEKNMWKIAGCINNFFKKPVQEYEGIKEVCVGYHKMIEENGFIWEKPIIERKETFIPLLAPSCHLHHVVKNRTGEQMTTASFYKNRNSLRLNDVLLAISSPFNSSCVPILWK